jgi:SAM-dependent methyltransferase
VHFLFSDDAPYINSWDEFYSRELDNYHSLPGDEGTSWFSESGAEEKIVNYLVDLAADGTSVNESTTSFLDLGCGNGRLLLALREANFSGPMLGLDYSATSIELAKAIENSRIESLEWQDIEAKAAATIQYQEHDILANSDAIPNRHDVLLDKGTFDAISLSSDTDSSGLKPTEAYRLRIKPLIEDSGLFVVTSCNWTEQELRQWFEVEDEQGKFVYKERLSYPIFRFGGREGSTIATVIFMFSKAQ